MDPILAEILAIVIFVALFAVGAIRGVHIGALMLPGAALVALLLASMTVEELLAGFPIEIMVLLAGVTYFFAIAQGNGTVDRLIDAALARVGGNKFLLPLVFFIITGAIATMGAPLAGLVMFPVGMQIARKYEVDYVLMALAMGFAIGAGGFAPTSLYGIVTYSTASGAGIELDPFGLFGITVATYLLLLVAAYVIFGRSLFKRSTVVSDAARQPIGARRGKASTSSIEFGEGDEDEAKFGESANDDTADEPLAPYSPIQILTVACMVVLIGSVVVLAALGLEPDIGLICFGLGILLAIVDPSTGKAAIGRIDWSTVLLVGGIITFVGVLQEMGAVELLGEAARSIGSPIIAALVLCAVGGLVSAFASTTGILAALVPLALPLVADGSLPGWALIAALGVCSAVVDVSPFSTLGATAVASAPAEARPRLTSILLRWGLSMVIVGPVLLVGALVVPAM